MLLIVAIIIINILKIYSGGKSFVKFPNLSKLKQKEQEKY